MKKLLLIFIVLFLSGCVATPPVQVQPKLEDYVDITSTVTDIPITNMPGHEPPEACPIECICPHWFGLDKSPCEPCGPSFWAAIIHTQDGLDNALKEVHPQQMVMLVYNDVVNLDLVWSFANRCDKTLVDHYAMFLITDVDIYYYALNKFYNGHIAWEVGDYVIPPAMAFMRAGATLPITFEGFSVSEMNQGKVCLYAEAFYEATKDVKKK